MEAYGRFSLNQSFEKDAVSAEQAWIPNLKRIKRKTTPTIALQATLHSNP